MQTIRGNEFAGKFVFMATRDGTVKKTDATAFDSIRSSGIRAIGIAEGDRLVDVRLTDGNMDMLISTKNGLAARFQEEQVRVMGRDARGVRGIRLREGDEVVGMVAISPDSEESLVTETNSELAAEDGAPEAVPEAIGDETVPVDMNEVVATMNEDGDDGQDDEEEDE